MYFYSRISSIGSGFFDCDDAANGFGRIGRLMARILVDKARRKQRPKHGGDRQRVELDEYSAGVNPRSDQILSVDEAISKLAKESPEKADLVKLRYFAGMSVEQAAKALGISRATADRYWSYAKAFLYCAMEDAQEN